MNIASDQDIINQLKEKLRYHQQQYKRIENTLSSFLQDGTEESPDSSLTDLKSTIASVESKSQIPKKTKKLSKQKPRKTAIIPLVYDPGMTTVKKIYFALGELREGFKEDIAAYIVKNEPHLDIIIVSKMISGILSSLKTRGLLFTKKEGRKDKFFIIK